jgi:translation initiation factor IF-3
VSTKELRINDRITARSVRLIGAAGEQLGVQPIEEALRLADEADLDLVLVSPDADPPVCKIIDYGKYKYEQKKRQHEHHKHQPQIKELRLRPKTEEHDLMVRVRQARQFIERGDRVIVNVFFRGREMAHADLGHAVMQRFMNELQDIAKAEKPPMMEGRRLGVVLTKK